MLHLDFAVVCSCHSLAFADSHLLHVYLQQSSMMGVCEGAYECANEQWDDDQSCSLLSPHSICYKDCSMSHLHCLCNICC